MLNNKNEKGLGTFAGVFTPSILTILGIILFLRTGYIVGGTGLKWSLVIILGSSVIALLTATSLSAIATNMRVKGGGDYYLISRTLGVEYGGAIGLVLFLAQTLSIAFYCFGFGEALAVLLPAHDLVTPRVLAAALLAALFVFAWLGADWASKLQLLIMVVLVAALVSFFVGGIEKWDAETLARNWQRPEDGIPFWTAFALFFPAVTGFTQGVSMSGDLRDPGRSLPIGTFAAVGLSMLVYIAVALMLAASLPADTLSEDYQAMNQVAAIGLLIAAGVMAATASSAMASHLGGPRILQALAADEVFPALDYFAKGAGDDNNPRRAVVLSFLVAALTLALGNLNAVAPLVAMFFLISYGLLNYATYFEARSSSPHFRPQFRFFHKYLSLAGALGCLIAMLAIQPTAAVLAIAVLFALYQYVSRTTGPSQWADSRRSYNFQRIRQLLFEMEEDEPHPRDWRPQILVLSKDSERRSQLLCFGSWIEGNSGITSVVSILTDGESEMSERKKQLREKLGAEIDALDIQAFPLIVGADDFRTGLEVLLQSYGVGPISANIVLLNWLEEAPEPDREEGEQIFGRNMRETLRLGCNIVALSANNEAMERIEQADPEELRIDVWWEGTRTSYLALMLAYLMTRTEVWRDAKICVHAQGSRDNSERTGMDLEEVLDEVRIDAEVDVVEEKLDKDVLTEHSGDAAVAFVPMRLKGDKPTDFMDEPLRALQSEPIAIALVLAGEDIDLDAGPDEDEDDDS